MSISYFNTNNNNNNNHTSSSATFGNKNGTQNYHLLNMQQQHQHGQRVDVDFLDVDGDFKHSSTRKSRFYTLFQQYEDEISRLLRQIESLNDENLLLKSNGTQTEMQHMFKMKYDQLQSNHEDVCKDRDRIKESYRRLESENSILLQEINRLKAIINENKSQISNHYFLENYDNKLKTNQQDQLVSDSSMETAYRKKAVLPLPSVAATTTTTSYSPSKSDELKFIKGDNLTFKNDLKVVKFVIDNNNSNTDTTAAASGKAKAANTTTTYSPSYTNGSKKHQPQPPAADRYKKNLSFDLEVPSPLTQSLNNSTFNATNTALNSMSYNDLINEQQSKQQQQQQHDTYSSTKRTNGLTREDFQFEKPNFSIIEDETLLSNHQSEQQQQQQQQLQQNKLNQSLTSEFNDCLQLLNEAESKIQSRSSPYVSKYQSNSRPSSSSNNNVPNGSSYTTSILKTSTILPDKYLRPQSQMQQLQQQISLRITSATPPIVTAYDSSSSYQSNNNRRSVDYRQQGYNSDSNLYSSNSSYRSRSVEPKN